MYDYFSCNSIDLELFCYFHINVTPKKQLTTWLILELFCHLTVVCNAQAIFFVFFNRDAVAQYKWSFGILAYDPLHFCYHRQWETHAMG